MKVLICGSRKWIRAGIIYSYVEKLKQEYGEDLLIIHGACDGADLISEKAALYNEVNYMGFPAKWKRYKNPAGPIRNKEMIKKGMPDKVVAFHNDIGKSKGTKNMIELARSNNIPYEIIREDI